MDAPLTRLGEPHGGASDGYYNTGFEPAPSLTALGILEQYRINSNSFQREMEALEAGGPPSPGKDGTWQYNAIKLLNSPASSPRGRGSNGSLLNPDALGGYTHAPGQPLQHPQPPAQPSRYHQPPAYSVVTMAGNANTYAEQGIPNWAPDMLQQARLSEASADGVSDVPWPSRLMNNSQSNGSGINAAAGLAGPEVGRYSVDGLNALTARLGSSSLDAVGAMYIQDQQSMEDSLRAASNHMLQQQMHDGRGLPQVPVHAPLRQTHYVTTGMLDSSGQAVRVGSAAMALPTVAVPPAAYGPASAPVLPSSQPQQPSPAAAAKALAQQQFQKRQRSVRSQLTFEAYENQYGPAAKCDTGPCADHCITPCKPHTCKCCKKHRRMEVAGAARSKGGYCGKCNRREKVDGLEFVKCNHTCITDGVSVTCGVEMLRDVFDNHWKQHKNEIHADHLPMSLEVDTDEGRKCGACTNMRPVTYYPNQDTNCSCSHCQVVKSKGGANKQASDVARRLSNTSGAMGSTLFTTVTGSGDGRERRHSFAGTAPGTPRSGPSLTQLTLSDNNNDNMSQQAMSGQGDHWSSLNQTAVDSLPSPGTAQIISQWASGNSNPRSSHELPRLQTNDPVSSSGWGSNTPKMESSLDGLVQQAEAMLSSALASVMSARPTLDMLLNKCQQLRYQPGPDQQAAHAAVLRIVQAGKQVEKEAQNLVAQATALSSTQ